MALGISWFFATPLNNDGVKVNGKDDIPYIENKKCLKPPTSYLISNHVSEVYFGKMGSDVCNM